MAYLVDGTFKNSEHIPFIFHDYQKFKERKPVCTKTRIQSQMKSYPCTKFALSALACLSVNQKVKLHMICKVHSLNSGSKVSIQMLLKALPELSEWTLLNSGSKVSIQMLLKALPELSEWTLLNSGSKVSIQMLLKALPELSEWTLLNSGSKVSIQMLLKALPELSEWTLLNSGSKVSIQMLLKALSELSEWTLLVIAWLEGQLLINFQSKFFCNCLSLMGKIDLKINQLITHWEKLPFHCKFLVILHLICIVENQEKTNCQSNCKNNIFYQSLFPLLINNR